MSGLSNQQILRILGRSEPIFERDLQSSASRIDEAVRGGRFLVVGGAGSIGAAVVRAIFERSPRLLHVVDIGENPLAELVRDLRSSLGYIEGEFQTYCLDYLGESFRAFLEARRVAGDLYDYVLNLAALKHVRSEEDAYTLMRMIRVNVLGVAALHRMSTRLGARRFFSVSTDKAVNPTSLMGASKRIMELGLWDPTSDCPASSARFANVAFSTGSLPDSWTQRLRKVQPISAPTDVRRYFITEAEAAILCLVGTLGAGGMEIVVPKYLDELPLTSFSDMAVRFLETQGLEPVPCGTEAEARARVAELSVRGQWPVYFFETDTVGEKPAEEFIGSAEIVDNDRYGEIAVVDASPDSAPAQVRAFESRMHELLRRGSWSKAEIVAAVGEVVPEFKHVDTGRYLDSRM